MDQQMTSQATQLVDRRREFHRYPEPSWCEYWTTARIVDHLEHIGVDEIHVGAEGMDPAARMHLPPASEREQWRERARERGADPATLDRMDDATGCVAVLDRGDGPHVGLRVDIDALPITEAADDEHAPAANGFRSDNEGYMHACGHDGHAAIGLGVLAAIAASDFAGRLTVFFQPAEEVLGGGKPMAQSPHVEGIDALFAVHLGLGHGTGDVVAGVEKPLSVKELSATVTGDSAHAGRAPNEGANAIQGMAAAVQSLYAIPRHEGGLTRVNVGTIDAGDAINVVAADAQMDVEVRAETDALAEYMYDEVDRRLRASAEMHDCRGEVELLSEAPRADSDPALREHVAGIAADVAGVDTTIPVADFGASEDATYLMDAVSEGGGESSYLIVGTDHPSGHHTAGFDIDEASLSIAVDVLTRAIEDY